MYNNDADKIIQKKCFRIIVCQYMHLHTEARPTDASCATVSMHSLAQKDCAINSYL